MSCIVADFRAAQRARAFNEYHEIKQRSARSRAIQIKQQINTMMAQDVELRSYLLDVIRPIIEQERRVAVARIRKTDLSNLASNYMASRTPVSDDVVLKLSERLSEAEQDYQAERAQYAKLHASRPIAPVSQLRLKTLIYEWNEKLRLVCPTCRELVRLDQFGQVEPHPEECGISEE